MRASRLRLAMIVLALAVALPAAAQFSEIRRAVDREIGGNRVWIPFKGLARLYVKAAHPEGIQDMQFAIYEGARGVGKSRIEAIFRQHLGPEWRPFVRMQNHRDGETAVIFAREGDGNTIDMMMFAGDGEETVLMYTTLDVDRFIEGLDEPGGFAAR